MTPADYRANVARQRLGYQRSGSVLRAVLHVTLPNGHTLRFERSVDLEALYALVIAAAKRRGIAVAEIAGDPWDARGFNAWKSAFIARVKAEGGNPRDPKYRAEVERAIRKHYRILRGGFLAKVWKGIKKVGKEIVTSGVFKTAGEVLTKVGGALPPPVGPAALVAGTTMKTARALVAARKHLSAGNKDAAKKLVQYAARTAPRALHPVAQAQSERVYALMLRPA